MVLPEYNISKPLNEAVSELYEIRNEIIDNKISPKDGARLILQKFGTEVVRDYFGQDYWINYVEEKIIVPNPNIADAVIITDYRFPNELLCGQNKDYDVISIRINANSEIRADRGRITTDKIKELSQHDSERLVSTLKVDYEFCNNTPHKDFSEEIDKIVSKMI